jgi:hypothetical protein
MKVSELVLIFSVFLLVFYGASSFLFGFQIKQDAPPEIVSAWNASREQMNMAKAEVEKGKAKLESPNLAEKLIGAIQYAFGAVFYVILSLFSVFVSIPKQVFEGVNYLASTFGIPNVILDLITGIVITILVIKAIEFVTGRSL